MSTSIFITGAATPIGSALFDLLLKDDVRIKAMYYNEKELGQIESNMHLFHDYIYGQNASKIEWVEGDVLDQLSLMDCMKGADLVFHCLTFSPFDAADKQRMFDFNVNGTANMVNAALSCGVKKFCYASSASALGQARAGVSVDEETYWTSDQNGTWYEKSMFHAEMEVWRGIQEGLDSVIVNPAMVLFPSTLDHGKSHTFLKYLIGKNLYPMGSTGFVDLRDVTFAMKRLVADDVWESVKNQRFLLCADNLTYKDYLDQRRKYLHLKVPQKALTKKEARRLRFGLRLSAIKGDKWSWLYREYITATNRCEQYDGSKIVRAIGLAYHAIDDTFDFTNTQNHLIERLNNSNPK